MGSFEAKSPPEAKLPTDIQSLLAEKKKRLVVEGLDRKGKKTKMYQPEEDILPLSSLGGYPEAVMQELQGRKPLSLQEQEDAVWEARNELAMEYVLDDWPEMDKDAFELKLANYLDEVAKLYGEMEYVDAKAEKHIIEISNRVEGMQFGPIEIGTLRRILVGVKQQLEKRQLNTGALDQYMEELETKRKELSDKKDQGAIVEQTEELEKV